jgi:Tol biopolymer transport system component
MLARPDGSGAHPLIALAGPSRAHGDWSPDGSKIVYQQLASPTAEDAEIWVANADGSGAHRVYLCSPPGCNAWNFATWAPDGKSIVFQNLATDAAATVITGSLLQSLDIATGTVKTLLAASDLQFSYARPRLSPDGKSLVFEVRKLDVASGSKTRPPDASIVGCAIGVLDLTTPGAKPRLLTDFAMYAAYPSWSPAGDRIIFNTGDPWGSVPVSSYDLYTVKPDGSGQTQLTKSSVLGGGASKASWSSDGKRVIFEYSAGAPGVASIAADGSVFVLHLKVGEYPKLRPAP